MKRSEIYEGMEVAVRLKADRQVRTKATVLTPNPPSMVPRSYRAIVHLEGEPEPRLVLLAQIEMSWANWQAQLAVEQAVAEKRNPEAALRLEQARTQFERTVRPALLAVGESTTMIEALAAGWSDPAHTTISIAKSTLLALCEEIPR